MSDRKIYKGVDGDYILTSKWHQGSAGEWAFAEKDGNEYFIKTLLSPIYPSPNPDFDESYIKERKKECEIFADYKAEVFGRLSKVSNGIGNLLTPVSYGWNSKGRYEIVSVRGKDLGNKFDMSKLDDRTFLMAMRVLCYNINRIHEVFDVHVDLKPFVSEQDPGNILFSLNDKGFPILRIIDFDDALLSEEPLSPDETGGTPS